MKFLFLLLILVSQALATTPCGKEGSIDDRIKECNFSKSEFALVVRTELGLEIYKDLKTGLFWGDRVTSDFNHFGSQKACSQEIEEAKLLTEMNWRLPTVHEFEMAAAHGMKETLPRMFHTYWTSTPAKVKSRYRRRRIITTKAFLWSGDEQRTDIGDLKDAASVRCVAKPK